MGGIEVDDKSSTKVKGLYAAGECANHRVHGANRLGGNSLLELIVFGKQAGESAAEYASKHSHPKVETITSPALCLNQNSTIEIDFYRVREELGDLFYKNVGISRDKESLKLTLKKVENHLLQLPLMGVSDSSKLYNTNLIEFLEFKNMLELSRLVLMGAIARDESRGAHFRTDKPSEDEKFKMHTIVDRNGVVS